MLGLARSLLLFSISFAVCSGAGAATVEPESKAWREATAEIRESLPLPGVHLIDEALEQTGRMVSRSLAAPLASSMSDLEQRRGLSFKYFPPWHVKSRQQLSRMLEEHLSQEYTPERVEEMTTLLKALALVPPEFELLPFLQGLYTGQIAGAYDPESDQLFLVDERPDQSLRERALARATKVFSDPVEAVILHELNHALGGQHFPFRELFKERLPEATLDEQLAVLALIEGDATFVMVDFAHGHPAELGGVRTNLIGTDQVFDLLLSFPLPIPGLAEVRSAPLYFQRTLVFPYYGGAEFVSALIERSGGWDEVNRAYGDLPRSTASILHPYRYLTLRREPRPPDLSSDLQGWVSPPVVYEEVCGELFLRIALEQHGVADFRRLAEGWNGDKIRVYRTDSGAGYGFVWAIDWLWEDAAAAFAQSLANSDFTPLHQGRRTWLMGGFKGPELDRLLRVVGSAGAGQRARRL